MVRWIKKGTAPSCLAERRREARREETESGNPPKSGDWAPSACTQPIREALYQDQSGLCGYCTQQIQPHGHRDLPPPGNGGMRIEHLTPREDEPRRMYDWDNLLGVCGGRSGAPGGVLHDHCDRTRGATALTINPTRRTPNPNKVFNYQRTHPDPDHAGHEIQEHLWIVVSAGLEADLAAQLNRDIAVLNLNNDALARGRRNAEKVIAKKLQQARTEAERRKLLQRLEKTATTPDGTGQLPQFFPVVLRYVRRKLRARQGT